MITIPTGRVARVAEPRYCRPRGGFSSRRLHARLDDPAAQPTRDTTVVPIRYASNAVGTITPSLGSRQWLTRSAHGCGSTRCTMRHTARLMYRRSAVTSWSADRTDSSSVRTRPRYGVATILLERFDAYKVRPAGDRPPDKFETGTRNHEAQAGASRRSSTWRSSAEVRPRLRRGFPGFSGRRLGWKGNDQPSANLRNAHLRALRTGLLAIPGPSFYGSHVFGDFDHRTPTAAFRR